jgi:hypothetical protein
MMLTKVDSNDVERKRERKKEREREREREREERERDSSPHTIILCFREWRFKMFFVTKIIIIITFLLKKFNIF